MRHKTEENRSEHFYKKLEKDKLCEILSSFINDKDYKTDDDTNTMKGFLQLSTWTLAQKKAVIKYLCKHENDFA
jgi:hypothetical protein